LPRSSLRHWPLGLLARPRSNAFGNDAYRTTELKAPAVLHSLAKNHSVLDGNKRIAWHSRCAFLWIDGVEPQLGVEEAIVLVIDIAGGSLDRKVIAGRLHISSGLLTMVRAIGE
jgi:death-on-curing protein